MSVSIKPRFTNADIKKMIHAKRKAIDDAILLSLQRVGEQFIADARDQRTYKDITGNLRSSIGYVILHNGFQKVKAGFEQIKAGGEGVKVGQRFIDEISEKYGSGWIFIAVAGMDYAASVESRGFNVITSSATDAARQLKQDIERIKRKVK
jgi:hypothetical protein